jgi:hypothetical protein
VFFEFSESFLIFSWVSRSCAAPGGVRAVLQAAGLSSLVELDGIRLERLLRVDVADRRSQDRGRHNQFRERCVRPPKPEHNAPRERPQLTPPLMSFSLPSALKIGQGT